MWLPGWEKGPVMCTKSCAGTSNVSSLSYHRVYPRNTQSILILCLSHCKPCYLIPYTFFLSFRRHIHLLHLQVDKPSAPRYHVTRRQTSSMPVDRTVAFWVAISQGAVASCTKISNQYRWKLQIWIIFRVVFIQNIFVFMRSVRVYMLWQILTITPKCQNP